jgi:hypothetical protein
MPKLPVTIKTISEKQKKEIESIAKERLTTPKEILAACLRTQINTHSSKINTSKSI